MGPLYFAPNQCLRETGFTPIKKASPIIAVIDSGENDIQEGVAQYYKMLTKK